LSPNAEEALSLLSLPLVPTKELVEQAANKFLDIGVGEGGVGCVIIRSGAMGAYVATRAKGGQWIDAFWVDRPEKVVDVTGAGNSFLGGLAAGLLLAKGDVYEAMYYATVSAGFTIEQQGLPNLSSKTLAGDLVEEWNGDSAERRLEELRNRHNA
jgi:sugar/nucleoside kinase (ribokinase family)